jgi:hypothetical protein
VTPSPTPTRALPNKANDASKDKDAPRLVALSPGLLGVGSALDKDPPSSGPDTDRDSEPPASEEPPTQRPPPPVSDSDAPPESEQPVASTDFLDSMADSAPALDSRDYVEEPPAPEPPKPRLPQAPPVRKLPAPARAAQDEPPSNTSAPKIDQLVHPPADKADKKKGPPRKRQASGDLTDDMLSADLGFDAPIALAPPDATALTRPPVSERPAAVAAASTKPVSTSETKQPGGQKSSSRGLLWVLVLVLLAGGAFAFRDRFTGGRAAPAAQAPLPEPPAAPPAPATATAEPVPEPAPAASVEPTPVAEPATTATAAPEPAVSATTAATARAPSPSPAPPKPAAASEPAKTAATAPATKPTATAAPIPEPPRGEATGPFDVAAAKSSLEAAAAQASSCRKPGDPSGVAVVTITFSPSGRVTSANIGGPPFAATPTGGCIASTLRKARVPPFIGEMVTIRKTVTIQ